jgi:diaminopimelate decarboxylase
LPTKSFHAIFCDSVEELERVAGELDSGRLKTKIAGIRLRTPNIPSRFGIPVDSPELFERLVTGIRKLPRSISFGIHFHMASSHVGLGQWNHLFKSMLRWCGSIEALSSRVVECLDVGGGWFPDDIQSKDGARYREMMELIPEYLSGVTEVMSEPGKALAQPTMANGDVRARDTALHRGKQRGSNGRLYRRAPDAFLLSAPYCCTCTVG